MIKPKLIILCGIPFSGKSTLAKYIAESTGYVRVDLDDIKFRLFGTEIKDNDISVPGWDELYESMYAEIKDHLNNGLGVVHDTGNFTVAERSTVRAIADSLRVPAVTVYLAVPESVARTRLLANRVSRGRFDVSDRSFNGAVAEMEIPVGKDTVIYDPSIETKEDFVVHLGF